MVDRSFSLEERVSNGNPFPILTSSLASYAVKLPERVGGYVASVGENVYQYLMDTFSPQRRRLVSIEAFEHTEQYLKAAECAASAGCYKEAFRLYEREAEEHKNPLAYFSAGHLARTVGQYERALNYHLRADNLVEAGFDAGFLGLGTLRNQLWEAVMHNNRSLLPQWSLPLLPQEL